MSEAYEIGVTLALSDGVSEGIERARRDMAQFETALARGGVTVQQLRRAAVGTVAPYPRVQATAKAEVRPAERAVDVVQADARLGAHVAEVAPASQRMSGRAAESVALPRVMEAAAPVVAPAVLVARETSAVAGRPAASTSAPALAPRAAERDVASSLAAAPVTQVSVRPVARLAASAGRAGATVPSAGPPAQQAIVPVVMAAPVSMAKMEVAPSRVAAPVMQPEALVRAAADRGVPQAPQNVPVFRAEARAVSDVPLTTLPLQVPDGRGSAPGPAVRSSPPPLRNDDGASERRPPFNFGSAAAVTAGPPGLVGGAPDGREGAGNRAPAPVPPQSGAQSQGPTEGDVFLDGMLVGRWMARYLADGAGRAPAGPTGFDGRRGRVLPGPTVGN